MPVAARAHRRAAWSGAECCSVARAGVHAAAGLRGATAGAGRQRPRLPRHRPSRRRPRRAVRLPQVTTLHLPPLQVHEVFASPSLTAVCSDCTQLVAALRLLDSDGTHVSCMCLSCAAIFAGTPRSMCGEPGGPRGARLGMAPCPSSCWAAR
jgi:hypothetical protein